MVTAAINILIYTAIFFLIGMFKPNWVLFFMKKPNRVMVMMLSAVLFMVAATLFGEGTRKNKSDEDSVSVVSEDSVPAVSRETKTDKESK
jgi:hypothetical protein